MFCYFVHDWETKNLTMFWGFCCILNSFEESNDIFLGQLKIVSCAAKTTRYERDKRFNTKLYQVFLERIFFVFFKTQPLKMHNCSRTKRHKWVIFWSLLVASADFHFVVALLALDEAAPVELTPAPLHPLLPPRRVAPVAAHQLATVDARTPLKQDQ